MSLPPIIASYYTLAGIRPFDGPPKPSPFDLRERIEVAARAGFSGLGVDENDLLASIARHGHAGIKAMLADNGLTYFELEGIGDWYGPNCATNPMRKEFLTAAERIGVSQIKVTGNIVVRSVPKSVMRAGFAALRRDAAAAGTRITLEMVCISDIATIDAVNEVIANSPDGAALLDIWHFANGPVAFNDIGRLPAGAIGWVELDDGSRNPRGSIISEQLDDRRLPGEGEFDIPGFLAAIRAAGYTGGVGVEILSEELRQMPLEQAARRAFEQTSKVLAAAGA